MNPIKSATEATAKLRESVRAILKAQGCVGDIVDYVDASKLAEIGFRALNADGPARRAA